MIQDALKNPQKKMDFGLASAEFLVLVDICYLGINFRQIDKKPDGLKKIATYYKGKAQMFELFLNQPKS